MSHDANVRPVCEASVAGTKRRHLTPGENTLGDLSMKLSNKVFVVIVGSKIVFRSPYKKAAKVFHKQSGVGVVGELRVTRNVTSNVSRSTKKNPERHITTR